MQPAQDITWDELKAMILGLAEQSRETDRLLRESKQETDRQLRLLKQKIEGIGDKFGYFTEGMALPSMERILRRRFGMETINPRVRVRKNGREQEYDVLAWSNGKHNRAIVVEVKSRVRREAILQLINQIETLFDFLPELSGKERLGILAGVDWDIGVKEEAQEAGLYTASIHGEVFEITTPDGFVPKKW